MANDSNKEVYTKSNSPEKQASKVLALGLISAASALAGGLAVAWWYRNTIVKLQNPIVPTDIEAFRSPEIDEESAVETVGQAVTGKREY